LTAPFERLPDLRRDGEAVWRAALSLREVEHLPVAWDASC
jgi:hypothetical protein